MLVPGGRLSGFAEYDFPLALNPALGIMVIHKRQISACSFKGKEVRGQTTELRIADFELRISDLGNWRIRELVDYNV